MPLIPLEPTPSKRGAVRLTLDKYYRLMFSRAALRELKIQPHGYVVLSVDVDMKRIGVAKQELAKVPGTKAYKVDQRGYISALAGKSIADKLALSANELPASFAFIGNVDDGGVYWAGFDWSPAE